MSRPTTDSQESARSEQTIDVLAYTALQVKSLCNRVVWLALGIIKLRGDAVSNFRNMKNRLIGYLRKL